MKCETCFFSKTTKVFDPVVASIAYDSPYAKEMMEKVGLSSTSEITKCHYAGKPQVVDASGDWCYQWKKK
jgi:hypothetical protein